MALTAERFIPDPFAAAPGARLYRTGDLVRQRADRTIEFLGRNDQQVKVRGYRIELGEIEQALGAHPALRQAVVVARPDSSGQIGLVGYITADGAPPTITALRQWLQDRLPTYMIPAAFVVLEQLPLTLNGKVDRRALPEPEAPSELRASYVAARTPTEQALSELWAEVLHLERVGIHDNFFALGGHSLLLAQLIGRIRETLHVELPLRAMFSGPTIAELTQQLDLIGWVLESEAIAESAEISREEFTI
jgi:acyl carrier protein